MPDRQRVVGFAVATLTSCIIGLAWHTASATALSLLAGIPTVLVLGAFAVLARRHHGWVEHLSRQCSPRRLGDTTVHVGVIKHGAVVAGLLRPRIYCDARLVEELSTDELRAVTLHERGHQRAFDPLRLTVLGLAIPVLRCSDRGRGLLARLCAEREILADRYAIRCGVRTSAIASALLKMEGPAPEGIPSFVGATELRLRALLGDQISLPTVTGVWILMGVAFGALLCTSSLEPDHEVLALLRAMAG